MDEKIFLLKSINKENDMGDPIVKIEEKKRYAKKIEIGQREFYQAAASGLKPEIKFEIWKYEYNAEMFFKYNNRIYKIIKTYERRTDEKIELTGTSTTNAEVKAYVDTESN